MYVVDGTGIYYFYDENCLDKTYVTEKEWYF